MKSFLYFETYGGIKMKRIINLLAVLCLSIVFGGFAGAELVSTNTPPTPPDSIHWWREARFGMFIHWGIYAQPAGIWKGQDIPSIGEWIMYNAKIPKIYRDNIQASRRFCNVPFTIKSIQHRGCHTVQTGRYEGTCRSL